MASNGEHVEDIAMREQNGTGRPNETDHPHLRSRKQSHSRNKRPTTYRFSVHDSALETAAEDETNYRRVSVCESSGITSEKLKKTREGLKRFYATPCEKWKGPPKRFPFKLVLQLLKVIIVTVQLALFAHERTAFEKYSQTSRLAFHHIFLKEWGSDQEVLPYPPGVGDYAMYNQEDLFEHMNNVIYQYYRFANVTLTALTTPSDATIHLNIRYYKKGELTEDKSAIIHLPATMKDTDSSCDKAGCYDVEQYLRDVGKPLELKRMVSMVMQMNVTGSSVKLAETSLSDVECVQFIIKVDYDNSRGSGQILVKLTTLLDMKQCQNNSNSTDLPDENMSTQVGYTVFDSIVMCVCFTSLVLALRSIVRRASKLKETVRVLKEHYDYQLTIPEMMDVMTVWYFQYVISDILVFAGTCVKIYLRYGHVAKEETFDNEVYFDVAGVMLGVANWSQWIGLIRFLGFFDRYYILMLTLSNAIPALIRFLVCGLTIYLGFTFCGWIILGPYNLKFETVSATGLALFSLMNGDEIYATMAIIKYEEHPLIWIISLIYLYAYVILFIFAIFNLFIAVIMDSYETVKNGEGYHKTFLHHFMLDTLKENVDGVAGFYEEMDRDEVDAQYGILSPLLCCLDRCVHHNVNARDLSPGTNGSSQRSAMDETRA